MKIAILAAGTSNYFPLFIDKPKSMYHLHGKIQLERVIESARNFVSEKDIIVVGGYKYLYIQDFLKKHYPQINFKINEKYNEPAIYSFRKAIEGENDDTVFMFADESISDRNVKRICESRRKLAILCHDTHYYYSLGILKLRHDVLDIINDDKYLSMEAIKEIYCFANNKKVFDGTFSIKSGICVGYIIIDFVRRIAGITKVEDPIKTYHGEDVDFLHYNPAKEYTPDLDYFTDTDEYKENFLLRIYSDLISDNIKRVYHLPRKISKLINKLH